MSEFTKGPWIYGVRHDGSKWLSIGDYKTGPHYQGDLYASESDAKLICSAPDLLEALQNLENDNGQIPDHAWKLVQDAIKKATTIQ